MLRPTLPELDTSVEASIIQRCDGRPAAIGLAALSIEVGTDLENLRSGLATTDHIAAYLHEELLDRLVPDDRDFLLGTSVLTRVHSGLCDDVLDRDGSAAVLERLVAGGNLFVVGLDDQGTWFRYHPLFRDLLLAELRTEDAACERVLRRRAIPWLRDHGMVDEAVMQALAAQERRHRSRGPSTRSCSPWSTRAVWRRSSAGSTRSRSPRSWRRPSSHSCRRQSPAWPVARLCHTMDAGCGRCRCRPAPHRRHICRNREVRGPPDHGRRWRGSVRRPAEIILELGPTGSPVVGPRSPGRRALRSRHGPTRRSDHRVPGSLRRRRRVPRPPLPRGRALGDPRALSPVRPKLVADWSRTRWRAHESRISAIRR